MHFFVIASLLVMVVACSPSSDRSVSGPPLEVNNDERPAAQEPNTDPTGYWILTEFHDSIVAHRRIGVFRMLPPLWSHLLLNVDTDSLRGHGTLLEASDPAVRGHSDTLARTSAYCEMTFIYDSNADKITVLWTDEAGPATSTLHYRRASLEELPFIDSLRPLKKDWPFRDGYHRMLLNELFVGRYVPLDKGDAAFTITYQGAVLDHPAWSSFSFHDYFGTMHPYKDDMDALTFASSTDVSEPYNWNFIGDTLVLTELETDGDRYWLGNKVLRYVKRDR